MFRIKICGVTSAQDARMAVDAGANAIGVNFYPGSKRCVSVCTAAAIADEVGDAVQLVGVFVNEAPNRINEFAARIGLDWVQLHGDEPVSDLALIDPQVKIIRVHRLDSEGIDAIATDLAACGVAERFPNALLVDAPGEPDQYGGTGQTVPWQSLADHTAWLNELPLVLAGGLTPTNVADAIRTVHPAAVDVASGVESSPGTKDGAKVRDFVTVARAAFASVSRRP